MGVRGIALALAVLAAACGPDQRVGGSAPSPSASTPAPRRAPLTPPPVTAAPTPPTTGTYRIRLVTIEGGPAAGVPVAIDGPLSFHALSDRDGLVLVDGPAGDYALAIDEGCTGTLRIVRAYTARFGIAAGQTGEVDVVVRFVQRFAPDAPIGSSLGPYWPPGDEVTVTFTVVDRCRGGEPPAPNRPFPTWRVRTNGNVRVVRGPRFRSDDRGRDTITVTCVEEGVASVVLFDRAVPNDDLDLVEADNSFGRKPSCRRPPG